MADTKQNLMDEFPPVPFDEWRAQVEKELKGASYDKKLVSHMPDGLTVQPIYVRSDWQGADDGAGLPGVAPYRRGNDPEGHHRDRWDLRPAYDNPDLEAAHTEIAADLARGATSLRLVFDRSVRLGLAEPSGDGLCCRDAGELAKLLDGVVLDAVGLSLHAGANPGLVLGMLKTVAGDDFAKLRGGLHGDPLGALATDGELPGSLEQAIGQTVAAAAHCAAHAPGLRAVGVSAEPYHDAGASAGAEIGYALATGVSYLRALTDAGQDVDTAASQIMFSVSVGPDFFIEIAKLRALRQCWARVVEASGGGAEAQHCIVEAGDSRASVTTRDPWVNMLRTTTQAFSAAVGGADAVTTGGFDRAVGQSDAFARRIARNTQIILNEEAHVAHVADPAGGSYYVENLTDELCERGWAVLQEVEAAGGMARALQDGSVATAIAQTAAARDREVARRKRAVTGISEFAHIAEAPIERAPAALPGPAGASGTLAAIGDGGVDAIHAALADGANVATLVAALRGGADPARIDALPVRPIAQGFEALRDRASSHATPPSAFLCNLGPIPDHKARATYASGFLNAGGIECIGNDGFADSAAAVDAFKASGTTTAVFCGTDDAYAETVADLAPKLVAAGATSLVLAGRPGDKEEAFRTAGVAHFIFMGCDAVESLSGLLDTMGVAS